MVRWKKKWKCEWKYCLWVGTCTNLWAWPIPLCWHHAVFGVLGLSWAAPVMPGGAQEVSCLSCNEGAAPAREYLASSLAFRVMPLWAKIVHDGFPVGRKGGVLPCKTDVYCCHVPKKFCSSITFHFFKWTLHHEFILNPERLPKKSQLSRGIWVESDWVHEHLICAPTCNQELWHGTWRSCLEGSERTKVTLSSKWSFWSLL